MATTYTPKKASPADWHPADIQAGLKKRGWSFRKLSLSHGYNAGSLRAALDKPWPRAEQIIAAAIGVAPWDIWPSRYDEYHNPAIGVRRRLVALKHIKPVVPINGKIRGSR